MESFVTRIGDVTIERVAPKAPPSSLSDGGENEPPPDTSVANIAGSSETGKDEKVEPKVEVDETFKEQFESDSNATNSQDGTAGAFGNADPYSGQEVDPVSGGENEYSEYPEDEEYDIHEGSEDEGALDPQDFLEDPLPADGEDDDEDSEDDEMMMPLAEAVLSEGSSKGEVDSQDFEGEEGGPVRKKVRSQDFVGRKQRLKVKKERKEFNGSVEDESEMKMNDEKDSDSGPCIKEEELSDEDDEEENDQVADEDAADEEDEQKKKKGRKRKKKAGEQDIKADGEGSEQQDEGETDMKKKLRTREKRKIIVEDDSEESEEEKKKKRKKRKKKGESTGKDDESESSEETESEDDGSGKKKKKKKKSKKGKKKEEDDEESGSEKTVSKATNLRRNIREVMDETQLDESTLAAQRQEMERLRRVQEQQRILREMAQQRQHQQKQENRVISILQGNTSILKQVSVGPSSQSTHSGSKPNTVVVKLGSGAGAQSSKKVLELLKVSKGPTALPSKPGPTLKPSVTRTLISKPRSLQGQTMMTPSVSIAPVRPGLIPTGPRPVPLKPSPMMQAQASYSASEGEEEEEEEEEEEILEEGEEGKKKKKDVVTISSSSSSEDDCIVLSEPSDGGEEEDEEDPTNSGMHTNDLYNVPDEEGRVQVNMGKPEGDPDIFLAPHIGRIIKPHQVGGIRFLYDNVIESIERFATSTGFGCILAHSMGLGKTLQVISFCDIFLRHTPAKTVMCIMPINTLQNWLAEFNMWLPEDASTSPLAAHGEVRPRNFGLFVLNDSHKTLKARAKVIDDWTTKGGVLLIGYEMYRQLSLKKVTKPKKSRAKKKAVSDEEELDPEEEEKKQKEMLEKVYEALVKPGPDLVICDEGHRIKNSHASISMALKQIRSKRRVVLTGYPLQNNLLEYWCMVDFVRPNYLGSKTEFCNMFERPIQNGQCIDSTPQDIRLMRYRAHVLHSLLEGFVQRRSHSVLQTALPQKEEYVLLVRMTPFQRKLYDTFMNEVVRTKAVPNPLKAFAVCCKIWNHPDVLYQFLKKREGGEGVDLDLEEAAAALQAASVIDTTGTAADERRTSSKSRSKGGSSKSRNKKGGASTNKPAAAVMPNTSSQHGDPNNSFGMSGQYGTHNQLNQNSVMNSYNPYNTSQNQSQYPGSFGGMSHHYNPNSPYGHSGYGSNSGFNSSNANMSMSGQGSFPGSSSGGYADSNMSNTSGSQSGQFGSSSSSNQNMFPGTSSSGTSTPTGYGSIGPPYFSGGSPSGQHSMNDNFGPSPAYGQNWSGSGNYNSFSQNQQGSQPPFPNQGYPAGNQGTSFQGYGAGGPSSASFNQSMYGASGSSGASTSSGPAPPYQQGMIGQQQMMGQNMIQPSNRSNHTMNPNMMLPQQSPVNASGMLPGGAPTKTPSMIPPSMNSNMLGPGMSMGNSLPGMSNMGENLIGHHGMNMGPALYPNTSMMGLPGQPQNRAPAGPMAALTSMTNSDVPPSAEDLLHAADEFGAFDPSMGNMMDVKKNDPQGMYDIKDRNMFDPWANSHPQNYDDVKAMEDSISKSKLEGDGKYKMGPMVLDHIKNEMRDVKLDEKSDGMLDPKMETDNSQDNCKDESDRSEQGREGWQMANRDKDAKDPEEKDKEIKEDEEDVMLGPDGKPVPEVVTASKPPAKEDPGIPYDWAVELMKDYIPGLIENSAKMVLFFCILEESLALGDRILVFSQSLFTLSLIEEFLQRSYIPVPGVYERWQRNRTYFRLDGSTAALEREKLINEFNSNPNVYMFLVSTRAGSLGINLVGANRVIVLDASWNPCHDTQAVCRVYRYGQKKPCFVYRIVMDNCLEKKIYDRQINKQGMSDRVVDECNPDAHLSIKEVTNLCWDDEQDTEVKDFSTDKDKYIDVVMQKILEKHGKLLSKPPFQHESLLVDRKDKKLSQAEKRLAKRSYEMEKRANNRPVYNYYNTGQGGLQIRAVQRDASGNIMKPIASVRPMQAELNSQLDRGGNRNTKWIPAEVWQRQGMSAQEMTLPLDVVIPTNSPERASIVLKAGQRVMVLKSPKGIYMQLENGKIIAIRTAFKMGPNKGGDKPFVGDKDEMKKGIMNKGNIKLSSGIHPLRNNPNITITPRNAPVNPRSGIRPIMQRPLGARMQNPVNMRPWVRPGGVAGRAVQLRPGQTLRPGIRGLSPSVTVTPTTAKTRTMGPVTITPRLVPNPSNINTANVGAAKVVDRFDSKDKASPESQSDSQIDDDRNENVGTEEGTKSSVKTNQELEIVPVSSDVRSIKDMSDRSGWTTSERSREKDNDGLIDEKRSDDQDSLSQSSDERSKTDFSDQTKLGITTSPMSELKNADNADSSSTAIDAPSDSMIGSSLLSSTVSDTTKSSLKNFRHATSSQRRLQQEQQQQQTPREPVGDSQVVAAASDRSNTGSGSQAFSSSNIFSEFNKTSPQSSTAMGFSGNFPSSTQTSSSVKPYSSGGYSADVNSPGYASASDQSMDESKGQKSPAEQRSGKKEVFPPRYNYEGDVSQPSTGHDTSSNQWKSPQAFSPGVPGGKTPSQQRSLASPAYDDNSNTSAHSSVSTKSSSNAPAADTRPPASENVMSMYYGSDSAAPHLKSPSSNRSQAPTSQSSSSASKSSTTSASGSVTSTLPSVTAASNFPALDPYANLYGGYGTYPAGLAPSNYYSPYGYTPGFLPDPKTSLASKSTAEPSSSVEAAPNRQPSSSSKSSSRSEAKKTSHESPRSSRSDLSLPSAYDSRQSASSTTTRTSSTATASGSTSSSTAASSGAVDLAASAPSAASAAAAAAAYNPMMMPPSFNPTTHQYSAPTSSSNPANPFTAAAAAAANYPSPYTSPYSYAGANQFESDLARASMYSAFHRPDPGQFPATSALDPASPYLPLPAHTRAMNPAAPAASSFYSQNVYGSQYGSARDPYAQLPPYAANPFMMPAPYGGLAASSTTSTSASPPDQAPSQ